MKKLIFSFHHTSNYPCNYRLRQIFLAVPFISRVSSPAASGAHQIVPNYVNLPSESISVRDLAKDLASNSKERLPYWKLSNYGGNPLKWPESIDQFCRAVDSQSTVSDEVKVAYLNILVTGRVDFAYSGREYKDALRVFIRKFGQHQTVVSAHLEKHNSVRRALLVSNQVF